MPISPPLTDNEALNQISEDLEDISASLSPVYDDLDGDNAIEVTTAAEVIRAANEDAVKTVITSLSSEGVFITVYENDIIAAILHRHQTWTSPLGGGGEIKAKCSAGTATLAIGTYTRLTDET